MLLADDKKRLEQEMCRGIVRIIKESTGRGPVKSEAFINENNVLVITEGFLLPIEIEISKSENGCRDVRLNRITQAMAKKVRYVELISNVLNRKVTDFFFDINPQSNTAVGVFLFE